MHSILPESSLLFGPRLGLLSGLQRPKEKLYRYAMRIISLLPYLVSLPGSDSLRSRLMF